MRTFKSRSQSYSFNDAQLVKLNLSVKFQDGKEKVALTTKTSGGKERGGGGEMLFMVGSHHRQA